jgi:cardiolipin synthase
MRCVWRGRYSHSSRSRPSSSGGSPRGRIFGRSGRSSLPSCRLPVRWSPASSAPHSSCHRSDIEDAYLEAIEAAEEEIIIASAYFFPGRRFRRALVQAASRGVRVVLLLQGRVEYVLLHYASRALYGAFLDAGVEIQEYTRSFLHAKVAVIDGQWATVGSSNIDPFSLLLGREANIVADDRRFAQELRESLQQAMVEGAEPVVRQRWRRQPLLRRVKIWIAYGIARFLMGMFGYGRMK